VAPIPWRSEAAQKVLEGQAASADLFARAAEAATTRAKALDHNGYKIPLVQGLLRQALHEAAGIAIP
jgi:xanthine dehydrogenase YagS FAD-binding subunit